jgi:hypothetical protein
MPRYMPSPRELRNNVLIPDGQTLTQIFHVFRSLPHDQCCLGRLTSPNEKRPNSKIWESYWRSRITTPAISAKNRGFNASIEWMLTFRVDYQVMYISYRLCLFDIVRN